MTDPSGGRLRAAIVSVGNELLFGETIDTNAAWLGRELGLLGIPVVRRFTVGDVAEDIEHALTAARASAGLVMVSGGLGPTPDDLTKPTVADLLDRPLVTDDDVVAALTRRARAAGEEDVPGRLRSQALVPEGAVVLENLDGTAPGLLLDEGDGRIVLLPGVPRELRSIFTRALAPRLREILAEAGLDPVWHTVVHTTGVPESLLAERVEAALGGVDPSVRVRVGLAYLPELTGVDLRFSASAPDQASASRLIRPLLDALEPVLANVRYEAPGGDLAEGVAGKLRAAGWMIATAESCTGGLVGKRLTDRAGASEVFAGGVIAYANEAKIRQLGVRRDDLERHGAVSEVVARQLAEGAARAFETEVGVGVTGVAGPGGGSEEKPVGTVWVGVTVAGRTEALLLRIPGDRDAVRIRAAQAALMAVYVRIPDALQD